MVPTLFENLRSSSADLSHNGGLNRKYEGARSKQLAHTIVGFFISVYFVEQNEYRSGIGGQADQFNFGVTVMKIMIVGNKRKDGKYKVKYYYEGAPNMFGGRDHGKCFTVLDTPETIHATLKRAGLESAENMDQFYALEGEAS